MNNLQSHISTYLNYCGTQKRLNEKTLKAYQIDLRQFSEASLSIDITEITRDTIENYIAYLHQNYWSYVKI